MTVRIAQVSDAHLSAARPFFAGAWQALRSNPWLTRAFNEPLGQGMTTGWAGFLSTRGSDLADAFPGVVLDVVASKLLADPFRARLLKLDQLCPGDFAAVKRQVEIQKKPDAEFNTLEAEKKMPFFTDGATAWLPYT